MLPTGYHMLCELKQTVPLLERELTPAEIRIGRETPFWVDETGTPMFDAVAKPVPVVLAVTASFDNRLIRRGNQTYVVEDGRKTDTVAKRIERRTACREGR